MAAEVQPVTFLIYDSFGHGGLARAVIGMANALADHLPIRMISMHGWKHKEMRFPLDPRIELEQLIYRDEPRTFWEKQIQRRPTKLDPVPAERNWTRLADRLLQKRLKSYGRGILVSTRPAMHLAATSFCSPETTIVGWDHLNFPSRMANPPMAAVLRAAVPKLTAYVVLTEADKADYAQELGDRCPPTTVIRNALSWPRNEDPATLDSKVVIAAGRIEKVKGFDRMVDAYEPLAQEFPDWTLRIFGAGRELKRLRRDVERRGLQQHIEFPGYSRDFHADLHAASFFAMTSRAEGFPMVLLEAMAEGLPLVSMDLPRGPGELIDEGRNGLLVPDGDVPAFTGALRRMMADDDLRHACGRQAWEDAVQYQTPRIVDQWLTLLDGLEP